jgi:signal transduction histidine kinase/CheY-like chemotaxis protein
MKNERENKGMIIDNIVTKTQALLALNNKKLLNLVLTDEVIKATSLINLVVLDKNNKPLLQVGDETKQSPRETKPIYFGKQILGTYIFYFKQGWFFWSFLVPIILGGVFIILIINEKKLGGTSDCAIPEPINAIQTITLALENAKNNNYRAIAEQDYTNNHELVKLVTAINNLTSEIVDAETQATNQKRNMEATIDRLRLETENSKKANEAKTKFLARVSHEIRTPINGILGMTQVLLDENLTSKHKYLVQVAQDSTNNLLLTINDLLDYTKLEAGKLTLSTNEYDILQLSDNIIRLLSANAQENGNELCAIIDPLLPQYLIGDELKLKQILINLVGNAIKFTKNGTVTLEISVNDNIANNETVIVKFAITDTGIGIDEKNQKKIFEAFSQENEDTNRSYGGTGLGLAISKQLVNLMDSQLKISSSPNKGSTFFFNIKQSKNARLNNNQLLKQKFSIAFIGLRSNNSKASYEKYCQRLNVSHTFLENINRDELSKYDKIITHDQALFDNLKDNSKALLSLPFSKWQNIDSDNLICFPLLFSDFTNIVAGKLATKPQTTPNNPPINVDIDVETEKPSGGINILYAEDNKVNALVAKKIISKMGHSLKIAEDGDLAFQEYKQNSKYDLVLLDCQMPNVDGLEAIDLIRDHEKQHNLAEKPIIMITANNIDSIKQEALAKGANDYLNKPFKSQDLQQKINHLVCLNN